MKGPNLLFLPRCTGSSRLKLRQAPIAFKNGKVGQYAATFRSCHHLRNRKLVLMSRFQVRRILFVNKKAPALKFYERHEMQAGQNDRRTTTGNLTLAKICFVPKTKP